MEVIRSRGNASLKRVGQVARGKDDSVCLLEGERLVHDALRGGMEPEILLVREERAELARDLAGHSPRLVAERLFDGLGTLTTPPGVLGVFPRPARRSVSDLADDLDDRRPALLLGVSGVADPGNLGALARCAEATGAMGLLVAAGSARPFGPKALRGSMGSLLRVPVFEIDDLDRAMTALDDLEFTHCVAATRGGRSLDDHPFGHRTAIWMTGETGPVAPEMERCSPVTIPMAGGVESLNVTVAGALLLFEAARRVRRDAEPPYDRTRTTERPS
ncbi:MAG: RNA methyltransferase [Planctomycetota bacterium]